MKKPDNVSPNKEVFKTIEDYEKRFFPKALERRSIEEQQEEPGTYGTTLAAKLLKEIRNRLVGTS